MRSVDCGRCARLAAGGRIQGYNRTLSSVAVSELLVLQSNENSTKVDFSGSGKFEDVKNDIEEEIRDLVCDQLDLKLAEVEDNCELEEIQQKGDRGLNLLFIIEIFRLEHR